MTNSAQAIATTEVDIDTFRVIDAIRELRELEPRIAQCQTVREVEDIRLFCQTIQSYARQRQLDQNIVLWAQEVAVKCQRRIGEVWNKTPKNKGGGDRKSKEYKDHRYQHGNSDSPTAKDLGYDRKATLSEAGTLASIPEIEFQAMLEAQKANGKIQERKLVDEIRAKAAEAKRLKKNESTRRSKAKMKRINADPVKATQDGFNRYWKEEQKLLVRFFTPAQLEALKDFWPKAMEKYIAFRKESSAKARLLAEEIKQQSTTAPFARSSAAVQ